MEQQTTGISGLVTAAKEYIGTQADLIKLNTAEKTSLVISDLVAGAIVAAVLLLGVVFASIAGAIALSDWIGKPWSGYLIVAGIYGLTGIMVWISKEKIIRIPVMNKIIHQLYKNDQYDEED